MSARSLLAAASAVSLVSTAIAFMPTETPDYCSHDMNSREIAPLNTSRTNLELIQVQTVVRHGARTPYGSFYCWENYEVPWNCNVTELMVANPHVEGLNVQENWLFRKLYDGSPNALGGNCLTGQLLTEGYFQETVNGNHLRDAYIGAGALKLYPNNDLTTVDPSSYYFRSDDVQRVLMSGQLVVHGMFNVTQETVLPWHTGDYSLDEIYPNAQACPALNVIADAAYSSDAYVNETNSPMQVSLANFLDDALGQGWAWSTVLDCFYTAVCTGYDVPNSINDTTFWETIDQSTYVYGYQLWYNQSQYSKLALGATMWQIRERVHAVMGDNAGGKTAGGTELGPFKFVLYAAHDTTIMPVLQILGVWDRIWPAYASMINFEIYRTRRRAKATSACCTRARC